MIIEAEAEIEVENPGETEVNPGDNPGETEQNSGETTEAPEEFDVVTIGDTAPEEEEANKAPEWVRELRKTNRELAKRNRELESRVNASAPPSTLPAMPKLEDFDYDAEKYQEAMLGWMDKKKAHDQQVEATQRKHAEINAQWEEQVNSYKRAKTELRVPDYEEAEDAVQSVLSNTQQAIIVQGAKNPALVVYALGKSPTKAKELGSIQDPVKFAFAIANMESELKVTRKTSSAPPPERTITGNAKSSAGIDNTLDRLRAEAEKTGNYTKVMDYKRKLASKS